MEFVTIQEFMNRINKNKEHKMLKDICSQYKAGRKALKSIMGFKEMFHRYSTNKKDGHKCFYITILGSSSEREFDDAQDALPKMCQELNKRYAEAKVNAFAEALKANKEGCNNFGKYIAVKVHCYNWKSTEWAQSNI